MDRQPNQCGFNEAGLHLLHASLTEDADFRPACSTAAPYGL